MGRAIRIGRILGIELRLDTSWFVIFVLVVWSVASLFGEWHPEWPVPRRWSVAALAALAFFLSLLFHELAHSLVARLYGIPVRDITLHLFGGVMNIEHEPQTPAAEFFVAAAGPAASLAIAFALMLGVAHAGPDDLEGMGSIGTLATWLGPVNAIVGLFNLVPGFPLDGGRILRAALWRATGSLPSATRWSTQVGQLVGFGFVGVGASMALGCSVPVFGAGLVSGAWIAVIGIFLHSGAVRERRAGICVADLMRMRWSRIDASAPVPVVVQHFAHEGASAFPVFDGPRFAGLVSTADVRRAGDAGSATARDLMTPLERLTVTTPDTALSDAANMLGTARKSELAVVRGDTLVGLLLAHDVTRWLARPR